MTSSFTSFVPAPIPSTSTPTQISNQPLVHVNGHNASLERPFERIDINGIKQELHDALGENGLRYWKGLNGYLLGQIGRNELESMVKGWLKGKKVQLHNRLLASLLHNAASPTTQLPLSPTTAKRKKSSADFDTDENSIEPRRRVAQWILGMGGRDRVRIRRDNLENDDNDDNDDDEDDGDEVAKGLEEDRGGKRKWGVMAGFNNHQPLAAPARQLPSALQLSQRLSNMAKDFKLTVPDSPDIGEFMAVGVDSTLGDVLHGIVHLTGRERPGLGTIRVPRGNKRKRVINGDSVVGSGMDVEESDDGEEYHEGVPIPTLNTFRSLFEVSPGIYPHNSSAVYKIQTGISQIEAEANNPLLIDESQTTPYISPLKSLEALPHTNGNIPPPLGISPSKPTVTLPQAQRIPYAQSGMQTGMRRMESVTQSLIDTGLLKLDKAGKQGEAGEEGGGGGGKKSKHNLHWKYEDPAIILRDVLG